MSLPNMSVAEAAVLESQLPEGMTPDMQDVALCMFEALLLQDGRCGQAQPQADWLTQLQTWAQQVLAQMQHLATQKGGVAIYFAKGITMMLNARDRQMCADFRGDYKALARKYDKTEMRVRQIVDAWQKEQFTKRQGTLGLDE